MFRTVLQGDGVPSAQYVEQDIPPQQALDVFTQSVSSYPTTPQRAQRFTRLLGALKETPHKNNDPFPGLYSPAHSLRSKEFAAVEHQIPDSEQFRGIKIIDADGEEVFVPYLSDKPQLSLHLPVRDFSKYPKVSCRKFPELTSTSRFSQVPPFLLPPQLDTPDVIGAYVPIVQSVTLSYEHFLGIRAEREDRRMKKQPQRRPASQKAVTGISAKDCIAEVGLQEIFCGDHVEHLNLCHVIAHGLLGDLAQDSENLVIGTATANAYMLNIETVIPSVLKRSYEEGDVNPTVTLDISVLPYPGYEDIRLAKLICYQATFNLSGVSKTIVLYFDMLKTHTNDHGISRREVAWYYDQIHLACFGSVPDISVSTMPLCPQAERVFSRGCRDKSKLSRRSEDDNEEPVQGVMTRAKLIKTSPLV
jgi:hypothetical protein